MAVVISTALKDKTAKEIFESALPDQLLITGIDSEFEAENEE